MQKATTHLFNSADKDKQKQIKTAPVPVPTPKKADDLQKADKKLLERIIRTTAPLVVGLLLSFMYTYELGWADGLSLLSDYHAQPVHPTPATSAPQGRTESTPGGNPVPAIKDQAALPNRAHVKLAKTDTKAFNEPVSIEDLKAERVEKNQSHAVNNFNCSIAFCDRMYALDVNSPVYDLVKLVTEKWDKPTNIGVLSIDNLLDTSSLKLKVLSSCSSENNLNRLNKLVVLKLSLKEFSESSGKDWQDKHPQNRAQVKLLIQGIDARTRTVLFEKELNHNTIVEDWARYQEIQKDSLMAASRRYKLSKAMRRSLELTSNDIINLLNQQLD